MVGSIGSILIACGAASDGTSDIPVSDNPSSNDASTIPGSAIGPAGGTVTENGVTVTIPAGALATSTPIHITESTVTPTGYTVSGKVYHFEPSGTHFAAPITIALPSNKPEIVYWTVDGSEDVFEPIETEFDEAASLAKVQITHFSGGFVGTSSTGITCVVKQPWGTCTTKTTIESPSFWYKSTGPLDKDYKGSLATNSIGLNRLANKQVGDSLLLANEAQTVYKTPVSSFDWGTANVDKDIITTFTARGSRGDGSSGPGCNFGVALIDVTCSGGAVRIGWSAPPNPADAGVSIDSGWSTDAAIDASSDDASVSDSGSVVDSSVEDAGTDSAIDDAGGSEDAAVDDAGVVDSGVADSGIVDSGTPDSGYSAGSLIQTKNFDPAPAPVVSGGYATHTLAFTSDVKAGDLMVVAYFAGYASTPILSDTVGSAYASALPGIGTKRIGIIYGVAPAAGKNSIVVKFPASSASTFVATISEFRGVTGLDTQSSWTASPKVSQMASFSSGSITTARSGEVLVAVGYHEAGAVLTIMGSIKGPAGGGAGGSLLSTGTTRYVSVGRSNVSAGAYEGLFTTTVSTPGGPDSPVPAAAGIAAFY